MGNEKDDIIYSIALDLDKIASQQKQLDEVVNKLANGQKKLGEGQSKVNDEIKKNTGISKENAGSMEELGEKIFGNVAKLTAVAFAVKGLEKAFDIFIEGEQALIIEKNFEQMANSVDVDSKRLIANLRQAANGLVDDTDLMQQATLSLMQMGKQAERLPELIALAKKASYATGKDIQEVIQGISFALETGNTRALKQYRLMVDSEKATREYARQHGVAVSHLDEAGKRAAIMNAVLDEGTKKYSNINTEQQNTLITWKQLTISIKQFFEEVGKLISKTVGPAFKYFIDGLTSGIRGFTEMISEKPKQRIKEIKREIEELEQGTRRLGVVDMFKRMIGGAANGKDEIAKLRAELAKLEEQTSKKNSTDKPEITTDVSTGIDKDKIIKDQSKVNQEILALRKSLSEQMAQYAITDETIDQAKNARIIASEQDVKNKIQGMRDSDQYTIEQRAQIEAQLYKNLSVQKEQFALEAMNKKEQLLKQEMDMASNEESLLSSSLKRKEMLEQESIQRIEMMRRQGHLSTIQMQDFEASERTRLNAGKMQVDEETERNKERLDKAGIASSQSFGEGFSRAAGQASKNAQKDLKDFGKQGTAVFGSLTKSISSHLEKWGSGEESAAEAAKGFVADFVADTAQMYGQMIMLVGLGDPKLGFTPNPQLIAAGAGLIALSGLVRGMAKRGGSSVGGGAGGGGDMGSLSTREADKTDLDEKAVSKRSVNITVEGNYFETEDTKRKLVDMIRQEGDATDFKYNFVRG